jgi:hypothetical protein
VIKTGRAPIAGALALAAAVALAIFAAIALASGATTVSKQVNVPAADFNAQRYPVASATVDCPDGFKPRSGGWIGAASPDPFSGDPDVLPQSMRYKGDTWKVQGSNEGQSPGPIKALQRCAKSSPKVAEIKKSKQLKPGSITTVTATCPKGTEVLRGGYDSGWFSPHTAGAFVFGARRSAKRTWSVNADSPAVMKRGVETKGNPQGKVTSIAYCGKGPKLTTVTSSMTIQPGDTSETSVKCPAGKTALFGGAVGDVNLAATKAVFPTASFADGDQKWTVAGLNFQGPGQEQAGKLKAYAYCA